MAGNPVPQFNTDIYALSEVLNVLQSRDSAGLLQVIDYDFIEFDKYRSVPADQKKMTDAVCKVFSRYQGELKDRLLEGLAVQVNLLYRSFLTLNGHMFRYIYPLGEFRASEFLNNDKQPGWESRRDRLRAKLLKYMDALEAALDTASKLVGGEPFGELRDMVSDAMVGLKTDLSQYKMENGVRTLGLGVMQSRWDAKLEIQAALQALKKPGEINPDLDGKLKKADQDVRNLKSNHNEQLVRDWKPSEALIGLLDIREKLADILTVKFQSISGSTTEETHEKQMLRLRIKTLVKDFEERCKL
jgi:hypothetical protein